MKRQVLATAVVSMGLVTAGWSAAAAPRQDGKLGPFLKGLLAEHGRGGEAAATAKAQLRGLRLKHGPQGLLVPVILEPLRGARAAAIDTGRIQAIGARVDAVSTDFMRVLVPFHLLRQVAGHPDVSRARAPTPATVVGGLGDFVSESVQLTGAEALQQSGVTGIGAKVAVVDLGFVGLANAKTAGELPADTFAVDLPGSHDNPIEQYTPHGVGVAEHVMDMAPGAALYCILVGDEVDLQNAADYIRDNGIQVANHSVGWVLSSYYDDSGPINGVINSSRDTDGVFWTVAAGNDAEHHWRGQWSDPDGDSLLNFTANDERMDLTSASSVVQIFLNWNQYGNSVTDLDLYVRDKRNRITVASTASQNGPQDPSEAVAFSYNSKRAPYKIEVKLYGDGPTDGLDMTVFSFYNSLEYAVASSSFMDPANAHGAYTVGAIYQGDWDLEDPPPEPYSSQGPTNDGRLKPDIAAPDGTTSLTYGVGGSFGTSFSAPTTAGAAALLIQQDPLLAPDDLAGALSGMAVDVGDPGPDNVFGAGELFVGEANEPPVATDDTATTAEDTPVTVDVLANDTDADVGDVLTVDSVTQAANGTVVNNGVDVTYTPDLDSDGVDSFTYTVSDGFGGSDTATVSVTVDPVNDAPVANDDSATTPQDTLVVIAVLGNDTDVDGDSLTVASVTQAANGTATVNPPNTVTYTPNSGYIGADSFTYTVSDGNGGTDTAAVTVTVQRINTPPVALDDSAATAEDTPATIPVLANDTDADVGDVLTVDSVTQAANGTVDNNGDDVTYTPDLDFNGTDSFTYTVSDGFGGSDTATVSVTVDPVNDAPVANDDSATTPQDTLVVIAVLGNDTDVDGDSLTVASVTQAANGTVGNNGGDVTYTPDLDFNGTDSFTYTVSDGNGGTDTAAVNVTVQASVPVTIASDGFESKSFSGGTGWLGSWTKAGDASVQSKDGPHSGAYHVRLKRSTGYIERSVDLSGASNVTLRFWSKLRSFKTSETAVVKVSPDGVSFTAVKTFTSAESDGTYNSYEIDLSGYAMTDNFTIAFDAEMGAGKGKWYIDDVEIVGNR